MGEEMKAVKPAQLQVDGKVLALNVLGGSEGERALDTRNLRRDTGLITYDPGYVNTGSCRSSITFIDGEKGILRYRGYPIQDLADRSNFLETAYLLIRGELPTRPQLDEFLGRIVRHSLLPEDLVQTLHHYPAGSHPMAILSAKVVSLSHFYAAHDEEGNEDVETNIVRLLAKMPTIAAFSYKQSVGQSHVYPRHDLSYAENFLNMMFNSPVNPYRQDPVLVRALDQFLVLHADHEQNCSTSAVRLVGSSGAGLYASISAGVCALWGPLHGGANQQVIEMLESIRRQGLSPEQVVARAKDKQQQFRLSGFGHRVYKTYDPRARIAKEACTQVLARLGIKDPLLDIAMELEGKALADAYFQERNLYPNVDFYTGITLRALGLPTTMYPVMFAIGRLPGWIAHWLELRADPEQKIGRPRQVYTGPNERPYLPIGERV